MRCQTLLAVACVVAALGGCATPPIANVCLPPHAISPYVPIVAHEEATPSQAVSDDEAAPVRRLRSITRRASKRDDISKESASEPERYTDEWWERDKRREDQLRPKLIICRSC
jgi:hypothetical protein